MEPDPESLFEALTPLGFTVRVTRERWSLITTMKHPIMLGREDAVKETLENPEQIRQSRPDSAYPTDAVKEGTQIWPK